jgi:putative heme degradation protein
MIANCFTKSTCIKYVHKELGEEMSEENIFATGIMKLLAEIGELGESTCLVRFKRLVHENSLH